MERFGKYPHIEYQGSTEKVLFVATNEWATTSADYPRPIIATINIGSCISFCGYNSKRKTGFLVHLLPSSNAEETIKELEIDLPFATGYQITIVGARFASQKTKEEEIIRLLTGSKKINGAMVGKDMYGENITRSLALDTATGETYLFEKNSPQYMKIPLNYRIGEKAKRVF